MLRSSRVLHALSAIAVVGLLLGGVNYAFFQKPLLASNNQITFPFPVLEPQKETCPYDLQSDTSFQRYLSDDMPFADR